MIEYEIKVENLRKNRRILNNIQFLNVFRQILNDTETNLDGYVVIKHFRTIS